VAERDLLASLWSPGMMVIEDREARQVVKISVSVAVSGSGHGRVLRPSGAGWGLRAGIEVSVDGSGLALWQPMDGLTAFRAM